MHGKAFPVLDFRRREFAFARKELKTGIGHKGFEMISNGAKACYFVDNNYKVIETLKKNKQILKIEENCFFIKNDFQKALLEFKENNLIFVPTTGGDIRSVINATAFFVKGDIRLPRFIITESIC